MIELRNTKTMTGMKCMHLYDLIYNRFIQPRAQPEPMERGKLIHKAFEHAIRKHAEGSQTVHDIMQAGFEAIETEEAPANIKSIAATVFNRAFRRLGVLEGRWKTMRDKQGSLMVEYEVSALVEGQMRLWNDEYIPSSGPWYKVGATIDWVAEEVDTGLIWVVDFKSRSRRVPLEMEEIQVQLPLYMACLNLSKMMTRPARGMAIYEMISVPESYPTLTQKGKLSKRLGKVDPVTFMQFVEDYNIPPEDYLEVLDKLEPFDRMHKFYKSDYEINNILRDFLHAAEDLATRTYYPRHMTSFNCSYCNHRTFCQAELKGDDTEELLETKYEIRAPEGNENADRN